MKYIANLSKNDLRALILLLSFSLIIVCYWGIKKSFDYQSAQKKYVEESKSLLTSLYSYGKQVRSANLRRANQLKVGAEQSLLSVASNTAKEKKFSFKRSQPEGDTELKVWLEQVNFDMLLWWLSEIERKNGIQVLQISVEKTDKPGMVDVRLTLAR